MSRKKSDKIIKEILSFKMSYEVVSYQSDFRVTVKRTYQNPDGVKIFSNFSEAKRAALLIYETWIVEIKSRSEYTSKRLTKALVDKPFTD